jgi:hypothetical protein
MHWTIKIRDRFASDLEINPRYRTYLEELQDQFKIMEKGHKSRKYETTPLDSVNGKTYKRDGANQRNVFA